MNFDGWWGSIIFPLMVVIVLSMAGFHTGASMIAGVAFYLYGWLNGWMERKVTLLRKGELK